VYGHTFPDWFQHSIRRWAKARAIELVSIGYGNAWTDRNWIDASPEDFARFMGGAEVVVTNFFHGCVFALANTKPFVSVLSDYRANKVRDLATTVGADRHVVSESTPHSHYCAVLDEPLDSVIPSRIATLRHDSSIYLNLVLR
jgi:hypothetical protein